MTPKVCTHAIAGIALVAALAIMSPVNAVAQTVPTFKVAWFNIQSGKGEPALSGHPSTFVDTSNCTDPSKPVNGWATGFVQSHLTKSVASDSKVVALGLAESWTSTCGSPENVRQVLGWKSRTSERNGIAMVAKYGFARSEEHTSELQSPYVISYAVFCL